MARTRNDVSATRSAAMTESEIQQYASDFAKRYQAINSLYLRKVGQHLRDIGELTPSDVHILEQMQRVTRNLLSIKQEIAKAANISVSDVDRIFDATAKKNARFAEKVFSINEKINIKENVPLVRLLEAAKKETADAMANLANTTVVDEYYRNAVDEAVQAVQMGKESYGETIKRVVQNVGQNGLKVQYDSGLKRRLDSAARMNVLDGVRHLNQTIMNELGEQFGADGVEIDAHPLCADDHLPYQGKQYSNKEFEEIQDSLERPFGEWNCRHSWHPIILGISEPAYSDEQLKEFRENSNEVIEIDGKEKTRYEWSQEMRKLETKIREEKEAQYAEKQSNVTTKDSATKIKGFLEKYDKIASKTGIEPEYTRTKVISPNTAEKLTNSGKSSIIDMEIVLLRGRIRDVVKQKLSIEKKNITSENGIVISDKQFGAKIGRHIREWGLDPSNENDRRTFEQIVRDIVENAEEMRAVQWDHVDGDRKRNIDVLAVIRGEDVVLLRNNNEFITVMKGGINNKRVRNGRII